MSEDLISPVDPAGRVQIVLDPALPSKCIICERGPGRGVKFVDFGASLDWYGAVVICQDCIKECISVVEHDPVALIQKQNDELRNELEVATNELVRYRSALDGLSFIRPDLNPLNVDSSVEPENNDQSDSEGTEDESDSDGSDSVRGSENISLFAD